MTTLTMSAHRRHRGPYSFVSELLIALADRLLADPVIAAAHDVELLTACPRLADRLRPSRDTLTSLAVPSERTRFYSRLRTRRISHGLIDLLRAALPSGGPVLVEVRDLAEADPTDQEFVELAGRRLDPRLLRIVAVDSPIAVPESDQVARERYVVFDGTDSACRAAYESWNPAERARAHDRRAAELEAESDPQRWRGAIPWHRERGSDRHAALIALGEGLNTSIDLGFYAATIDFAHRGMALLGAIDTDPEAWWMFATKATTALAALGRVDEIEPLYVQIISNTTEVMPHLQASYARGMVATRHRPEAERDHAYARLLLHQAIAFARLLPDPKQRFFWSVFCANGLALVQMHQGDLTASLAGVEAGIAMLDRELAPHEHALHRSVLRHNRAQLLMGLGRLAEAEQDLRRVIDVDPNYPEYHFDLAGLLRRLDRAEEALVEYERCIAAGPPFAEAHYNRADALLALGRVHAARDALDYVLDLEPEFVPALISRADLALEDGAAELAVALADVGLRVDADAVPLRLVRGQAYAALGRDADALADLRLACPAEPTGADVELLFNIAWLQERLGHRAIARETLALAHRLAPGDESVAEELARLAAA